MNGAGAQEYKCVTSLHSQCHLHSDSGPHPLTEGVSACRLPPLSQAHERQDLKDMVLTLKSMVPTMQTILLSTRPTMQTLSREQTVEILRGQEAHSA